MVCLVKIKFTLEKILDGGQELFCEASPYHFLRYFPSVAVHDSCQSLQKPSLSLVPSAMYLSSYWMAVAVYCTFNNGCSFCHFEFSIRDSLSPQIYVFQMEDLCPVLTARFIVRHFKLVNSVSVGVLSLSLNTQCS